MSRLLKLYYRDADGVFRAIDGLQYRNGMLFVLARVYTLEDDEEDNEEFWVFKEVKS